MKSFTPMIVLAVLLLMPGLLAKCAGAAQGMAEGSTPDDQNPDCIGEGVKFTDENPEEKCCGNLKHAADKFPDGEGGCDQYKCPCYICINCGDGTCGKGENYCNCPEDCSKNH